MSKFDAKFDAKDVGYVAKVVGNDGEQLDTSWRMRGSRVDNESAGVVYGKELKLEEDLRNTYQKVSSLLEDYDPFLDASGVRPAQRATNSDDPFAAVDNYILQEQSRPKQQSQQMQVESTSWSAVQHSAKLKSGKQIPVWKVTNTDNGMEMPRPFRIQEAADRVAAILNTTGNVNHPKINEIVQLHDQNIALKKQLKETRMKVKAGQTALKPKLNQLLMEVEQTNLKLGI